MKRTVINVNDTIAAISTPVGEGGIGMVRISGPGALDVADAIFEPCHGGMPSEYESHTVHYGWCRFLPRGETADEVLLTVMRAPRTYTAEDVVEISCHGGGISLKKVLGLCLSAGARIAEPGEFTKRAFLNGRIDLSQAEAVLDVIQAGSGRAQELALGQLRGAFSEKVRGIIDEITGILTSLEISIDFSDQDIAPPAADGIKKDISRAAASIREILDTADRGILFRQGAAAVICGRPNVGKSSLMNALLRHDRVIVTPVPGTTRDVIEESIDLGGIRIRLSDTAGMIETRDRVEIEGIKRSREKLASSDVAIFVLDSSAPLSERDMGIFSSLRGKKTVVVMNKTDLPSAMSAADVKRALGVDKVIAVSALKKLGLDALEDALFEKLAGRDTILTENTAVTNLRHKECLEKGALAVERALDLAEKSYNPELLASDLNEALYEMGLITGESIDEDVLDRIFSRFCVGK